MKDVPFTVDVASCMCSADILIGNFNLKLVTQKPFTSNKKGDVGLANCFSKKYGNKG